MCDNTSQKKNVEEDQTFRNVSVLNRTFFLIKRSHKYYASFLDNSKDIIRLKILRTYTKLIKYLKTFCKKYYLCQLFKDIRYGDHTMIAAN